MITHFLDGVMGGEIRGCTCGAKFTTRDEWSDHAASVTVSVAHLGEAPSAPRTTIPHFLENVVKTNAQPAPQVPTWEVEDTSTYFQHRVALGALKGDWRPYGAIATLVAPDAIYMACTAAYEGSLPTECVFTLRQVVGDDWEKKLRQSRRKTA